jgi:hypothetical protein
MDMKRWGKCVCLVVALIGGGLMGACGGGTGTPTTPSQPATPTPVAVSLTLGATSDLLTLHSNTQFAALANYSDGSTRSVTPTWSTDVTGIVNINSAGMVFAASSGEVTIAAEFSGLRATRRVQVAPTYTGTWAGTYRVAQCSETGDWRGLICFDEDPTTQWGLPMSFTQDALAVSGWVDAYTDIRTEVRGSVSVSGQLSVAGQVAKTIEDLPFEVQILDWSTWTLDNQAMAGRFTLITRVTQLQGEIRYVCEMDLATKVTAFPSRVSPSLSTAPMRRLRLLGRL